MTYPRTIAMSLALLVAGGACATQKHMEKMERDGKMLRVELAQTYIDKGAYDAAIPLLRRAVAELPESPMVRTLYGTVLRERKLYPQAERELKAALEAAPDWSPAYSGLGILYSLMHRHDEAIAALRKAVELSPAEADYWNNLGFALLVAGRAEEAVPAFEQALALDPSLVVAYNNLGFAYGRLGDYDAAKRCFSGAGDEATATLNLALVYERNGDLAQAERLRSEAVRMAPELEAM